MDSFNSSWTVDTLPWILSESTERQKGIFFQFVYENIDDNVRHLHNTRWMVFTYNKYAQTKCLT